MSDMADVLMDHHSKHYDAELGTVFCLDPTCGWNTQAHNFAIAAEEYAKHQRDMLSAAGFGPVQEAQEVAFDYGWREGKGIPTPSDTITGELFHDQAYRPSINPYRAEASS